MAYIDVGCNGGRGDGGGVVVMVVMAEVVLWGWGGFIACRKGRCLDVAM